METKDKEDLISQEMSVEALVKILRVHSLAAKHHDAQIKSLTKRNEELVAEQNILRANIETLRSSLEGLQKAFLRAVPRHGRGQEAN